MAAEPLLRFLSTSCPPAGGLGDRARSAGSRRRAGGARACAASLSAGTIGLRVDDLAAALNTAATLGAVKVDAAAYRAAALDAQRTTGELLPGCVIVPASEHFSVSFGKDSGERDSTGDE